MDRDYRGGVSVLTFGIEFLPPLLWRPFQARGPQESHKDYIQFHFLRSYLFLGGEKVAGLSGGCDKVVLLVKVALEERQVAGGGFHCNLVKNWYGEKMCLVWIWVDRSLGVSVFSIGCSRRRYLVHEILRTLRYHRRQLQV